VGVRPRPRRQRSRARGARLFAPYFAELGIEPAEPPPRFHPSFDEQVDALLEARPPVFSFVFGIPSAKVLAACKERHIVTLGAATTIAEARALDEAGVDAIVATGAEAGGHRPSFLARAEDSLVGTMALTPLIADRVSVPVIAAGGIASPEASSTAGPTSSARAWASSRRSRRKAGSSPSCARRPSPRAAPTSSPSGLARSRPT